MHNLTRRLLSILLTFVMLLGIMPTAFAATGDIPYEGDESGAITVTAKDAITGNPLNDVTFLLEDVTGGRYKAYDQKTTQASGVVTWTGLSSGTYRVTQVRVPDGYILETNYESIYLQTSTASPTNYPVTFTNFAESGLYIYRFDPNPDTNFKPLAGATFEVRDVNDKVVATGTTDETGYFVVPHLPVGQYTVVETVAPTGYNRTPSKRTVNIVSGGNDPYVVDFSGDELSSITVINLDSDSREPIAGSEWMLYDNTGKLVQGPRTSNENGMVYFPGLEPGTYMIRQRAVVDGYIQELQSSTVKIEYENQKVIETLYNTALGNVTVSVTDSDTNKPLPGCSVTLYTESPSQLVAGPKTTNSAGLAIFDGIPDGNYYVTVVAPDGYVISSSSYHLTVHGGSHEQVPLVGTRNGGIVIKSVDAANPSVGLPGTQFVVRNALTGNVVDTYTTGIDGTVTIPNLNSGYYTVEETQAPAGYIKDTIIHTPYVSPGKTVEVTFSNRTTPFITVRTLISGTNTPIPNCTVSLYSNETGSIVRTATTDANGLFTFTDLNPGNYTAKFEYAPDGYTIVTASQNVNVTTTKGGLATLFADSNSSIIVTLYDGTTREGLSNAIFQVRDALGNLVETITTGADGTAVTGKLAPGRYTVSEFFAPNGYAPETVTQHVQVVNNESSKLNFVNYHKTAIVVYAYDMGGNPIPNVSYIIRNGRTGKEVSTILTDAAGVAVSEALDPDVYTVIENIVPDGYVLYNPIQARTVVNTNEATTLRFVHVAQSAIKMETVDDKTGEGIPGAVYQVMEANGDFQANFVTDENGDAYTQQLPAGTYYVKQIVAPDGYLLNTTTQTIRVTKDELNLAKFSNTQMSRIVIQNTIQGSDFGLAGCSFTVEDSTGKQVFHATTDKSGLLTTGDLAPGRYTVKEIQVADGYTAVQVTRTVDVTSNLATTVKFENIPKTCIIIHLTDEADPSKGLSGVTFQVRSIDGKFVTEVVTDAAGKAITEALTPGKYEVNQFTAAPGYNKVTTYQWANVTAGQNALVEFTNAKISGLTIQALVEGTHKGLSGAVFEIYHENGKLVKTVTSDATGIINIGDLAPDIYLIKEITVPDGYTARTTSQKVTVTTDDPTTATFYHTTESGLTVNLTDAESGAFLKGGVFRVYQANGDYVGEYTTNASGQFVVPSLAAGKYTVEMITAPDGYVIDTTPHYVTIKDDQNVVLDVAISAVRGLRIINTCKQDNEPIGGSVFKICKYDGTLVGNYTTNSAGLINVTLEPGTYTVYQTYVDNGYVKNNETWNITIKAGVNSTLEVQNVKESGIVVHMVDASTGKGIYNVLVEIKDYRNNYVGQFRSDNSGNIYLTDVLDAGRYTINILSVPSGYVKDTVPKTIVVKTGETTELTWRLSGEQGQVTIVTYSADDNVMMNIRKNTKLSGAIYTITDASGNQIASIQGDLNGNAYTGALAVGTYYIQQVTAPSGYQLNSTRFMVNVSSKNDDIRVEVWNNSANYSMTVEAHGQATAMAGAQVKYWFTNVRNDSTSPMNNFYLNIKVPTDVMRAGLFYTGTYNHSCTYSVQYKTNLNDYRTLASGLNSKSNYSYDLSTQSLGLGANEWVTDVRLVFPTVIAGFHESMAPTLYTYVLSTVRGGSQATVRCEVGGQVGSSSAVINGINYAGQNVGSWSTGAGQFTTMVYGYYYQNYLPSTLPKTGY